MSIPANKIDWPVRCENVLRKIYAGYYTEGDLSLSTLSADVDHLPEAFLQYHNFGQKSLDQLQGIISDVWAYGMEDSQVPKASNRCPKRATSGDGSCANYEEANT